MEYHINSFSDYLKILKAYRKNHAGELWFRGQRNCNWKLEPNLYRNKVLDVPKGEIANLNYKTSDFMKEFDKFIKKVKKSLAGNLYSQTGFL